MSVEMLMKPDPDKSRDINDNDLDVKQRHYLDTLGERKPTLVIPEPKRLSPLATTLTPELHDKKSPKTSPSFTTEMSAYSHLPWQSPFYPAMSGPYPYFPYRIPGFPFPPYPDHLPLPPLPDHIRPCSTFGTLFPPFPFPQTLSSFHFPIPHDKIIGLERKAVENDRDILKSSYEKVKAAADVSLKETRDSKETASTTDKASKKTVIAIEPTKYQCTGCQKSYSTFSGLSKHRQFHCSQDMKKEFACKYCEKTYVSLGALKMHIRTHTLPCKCKICGKAFSRPWLLQGHIRTHTGEKPFSCVHCLRAFADRSNLRAHLQTHSDVKKYSCKTCSKTFSRMSLLIKHEESCRTVEI